MLKFLFLFLSLVTIKSIAQPAKKDKLSLPSKAVLTEAFSIDSIASQFLSDTHHVGLSVGVYTKNGIHTWHYGSIRKEQHNPPNDSTVYEIASITKSFTGILLAEAVVDQKLQLNNTVTQCLGESVSNLPKEIGQLTLLQLANHTSGLPKNVPPFPDNKTPAKLITTYGAPDKKTFLQNLSNTKLLTTPGTHFSYSNAGTQLLSLVLEKVYGESYDELVQKQICIPSGMLHTGCAVYDTINAAQGYDGNGTPVPGLEQWKHLPAAGYLKSTIADMLNYIRLNLDESNPAIGLSHQPTFKNTEEDSADIGLFWFSKIDNMGERRVMHAGGSFGTTSYCEIIPAKGVGVIIIANDASPGTERAIRSMATQILSKDNLQ